MILFICWVRGGLERVVRYDIVYQLRGGLERVVRYDIVYLLGKGWFRE